ncbi:MAG: hypothetical protein V1706_07890 [Pseudomonadota bacterium]
MPPPKNTKKRVVLRTGRNPLDIVSPDVYIGLKLSIRQYPIKNRRWSLMLPSIAKEKATESDVFHKQGANNALSVKSTAIPPNHPFNDKEFLPPKDLYDLGVNRNSPDSILAALTINEPLVPVKKGYRLVKEAEKNTKNKEAEDLNRVLGQAIAIHVLRDRTFELNNTGRFACAWITGQSSAMKPTEKLALILVPYIKTTINDQSGIFEIKNGVVTTDLISEQEYEKRKHIDENQFNGANCGGMPLIPGVLQVHVLIEQDPASGTAGFVLKELHCDGDRLFPEN